MPSKIWYLQSPTGKHYVVDGMKSFVEARADMFPNPKTAYVMFKRIARTMRGGNDGGHCILTYKGWRLDKPPVYPGKSSDECDQIIDDPALIDSEPMERSRFVVGARIRALRKSRGLTQRKLADMIGTNIVTISSWELGKQAPSIEHAHRIASALNCDVSGLIIEVDAGLGLNDYALRMIRIREDDYRSLKLLARKHDLSIGDMISKLIANNTQEE